MNSNLVHNILNVSMVVLAAGTSALMASGCTTLATGTLDCSASWINPTYTTVAIAALGAIKLGINFVRDGLDGMTKPQPPVQK